MLKSEKERVVAELTERLRVTETLIVADYRGLTNAEIDGLRSKLIEHGARFAVVKNTLTRRAAEAAGAEALRAQLVGAIVSPLTTIAALVAAPLRDLAGLIDARIEQLKEQGDTSEAEAAPAEEPAAAEPAAEEAAAEAEPEAEAAAEPETTEKTTDTETQEEQE